MACHWQLLFMTMYRVGELKELRWGNIEHRTIKDHDGKRVKRLIVKMQCRGHRELIWELMHPDWLGFVQIESPDRLKEEYAEQLERAKKAVVLG